MNVPRGKTLVPELGELGAVKLIGLGGVGGIIARYLCVFLAASDAAVRLVLVDGDGFEPKNAARMLFSRPGNKAAVVRDDLLPHVEDSGVALLAVEEFVTPDNLPRLVREGDVVFLAVDNHATRKLVSDFCAGLDDVCLVSGGNDGVGEDSHGRPVRGTYGNVQVYLRRNATDASPSLTRYHPEIADPKDKLPGDASCTELLSSVPQILFANLMTASAMLNAFWLYACKELHYSELSFDIADGLMRPAPMPAPALEKP